MKYHFIHERGDYPILAIEDMVNAWSSSIKNVVGYGESPLFLIYKNGWARIFGKERRYKKIVNFVWQKINQDKRFVLRTKKGFIKKAKIFLSFVYNIEKLNLRELSYNELVNIKKQYRKLYHQTVPFGEPIPYFLKEKIQDKLNEYLLVEKKVSMNDYEELIRPAYLTFIERAKKELHKLVNIRNTKKLNEAIKIFTKKYQWIHFDYASLVVDKHYFEKQLQEFRKNPPLFKSEKKILAKKISLIDKYSINSFIKYLINVLDDCYFLMDYKKEVLTQGHFIITKVYKEICRRLDLNLNEVYWLTWREAILALQRRKKVSKNLSQKRRKFCVTVYIDGKLSILNFQAARKLIADIEKDQRVDRKIKEIVGITGSPGKAMGKIRYLKSARESHKVKTGEILLVSNTTPDFLPAIRKAKAIITNEGGITCHAAIVSREIGIPCVVGTKIATQVLKDGDRVLVDANKGIVKKL